MLGQSIAETIVPPDRSTLMKDVMDDIMRYGYRESEHMVRRKEGTLFPAFYFLVDFTKGFQFLI